MHIRVREVHLRGTCRYKDWDAPSSGKVKLNGNASRMGSAAGGAENVCCSVWVSNTTGMGTWEVDVREVYIRNVGIKEVYIKC